MPGQRTAGDPVSGVTTCLIPSLSPEPDGLRSIVSAVSGAGIRCVVVANGKHAADVCAKNSIEYVTFGRNLGFGRSLNRAKAELQLTGNVLLLNDDVIVDADALQAVVRAASGRPPGAAWVISLGDDVDRPLPDALSIFTNLSLLEAFARRLARFRTRHAKAVGYRAFSAVLLSADAWESVSGFDERFPFTFEDADMVRQLLSKGVELDVTDPAPVTHLRSRTTSAHVATVLPIVAWSACQYAEKWGYRRLSTRALIAAALLVRVLLVPFSQAPARPHLRGIARALRCLVKDSEPALPPYDPDS